MGLVGQGMSAVLSSCVYMMQGSSIFSSNFFSFSFFTREKDRSFCTQNQLQKNDCPRCATSDMPTTGCKALPSETTLLTCCHVTDHFPTTAVVCPECVLLSTVPQAVAGGGCPLSPPQKQVWVLPTTPSYFPPVRITHGCLP